MIQISKIFIYSGALLIIVGCLIFLLEKCGLSLGRLPGDFIFRRGNMTVYAPLATSLFVSILVTIIFLLFKK